MWPLKISAPPAKPAGRLPAPPFGGAGNELSALALFYWPIGLLAPAPTARGRIFMQCDICGNYLLSFKDTKDIRALLSPILVKIPYMEWNSQVTNNRTFSSYLVGTSETTRTSNLSEPAKHRGLLSAGPASIAPPPVGAGPAPEGGPAGLLSCKTPSGSSAVGAPDSSSGNELKFNQWLAGLIDGDGSLLVSKAGYTSCEITAYLADEPMLRYVQDQLSGSIKLRSGVKAVRYRLHNKPGMIDLINRINGLIRNTARIKQLHHVCSVLNIPFIYPDELHNKHSWFSGFFDADGTLTYSFKGGNPQLTISVTNRLLVDVIHFQKILGGYIYYDRSQNGYYKWTIQKRDSSATLLEYFKHCPSYSIKSHRLHLIKEYYRLVDLSAFKAAPHSALHKAWLNFNDNWNSKLKI